MLKRLAVLKIEGRGGSATRFGPRVANMKCEQRLISGIAQRLNELANASGEGQSQKGIGLRFGAFRIWAARLKIGMTKTGVWNDKTVQVGLWGADAVTPKVCTGLEKPRLPNG